MKLIGEELKKQQKRSGRWWAIGAGGLILGAGGSFPAVALTGSPPLAAISFAAGMGIFAYCAIKAKDPIKCRRCGEYYPDDGHTEDECLKELKGKLKAT